ncbi:FAD-dependent oxidoreductase [Metabacillus malikii]|uniref:Glycine/D-amino acid oxidase-like deaminating enzyme/nitrite reductase/ring-hydroxylating ferredoxin subunit n=1 Tax=Metabacillus malikii TaxID=1504265 RepID=A0ABT9ZEW3_9BACI|nr:FAD-dependent oxidoreductase [Metabacillus malikii]MDQ0230814.1 glycine/D-amino acid oxidase-like deaminating enzyme/nitrite reductase/ring-hydroxylating ferredoxin subunit [Metabacillus malikii]
MTDNMPQKPSSYWQDSANLENYPPLTANIDVDVTIVGGGITGITTAYLLVKSGLKVAILEASTLFNGTTGHTTAKITAQHGLIYDELIQHMGIERAKQYYEANQNALDYVRNIVKQLGISCDLTTEDAIMYAVSDQYERKIETEYRAYEKLGIPSEFVNDIALPFDVKGAIVMKEQGQFHPLTYLKSLVAEIIRGGGTIYEQTTAVDIDTTTDKPTVITRDQHRVTSKYVISCSHFPFYDGKGFYFTRLHAERSYVLGITSKTEFPGGMYYSADSPTRSIRYTPVDGEKLILVSGDGHKTGQGTSTYKHYKALEDYSEQVLGINEIKYRWSAQDLYTLDNVPYVGSITSKSPNVLVATGYRKWGMSNGTAAAHLLHDIVLEKENPYRELYNPSRFYADPSIKTFLMQNLDVAGHLIEGKFDSQEKAIEDIGKDEAAIIRVNGQRAGCYRDMDGHVQLVDTTCTHMGCEVEWNSGDRSWDCPCHGSRFATDGEVLEGPATKPLPQIEL